MVIRPAPRVERAIVRGLLGLPSPALRRIVGPPRRSPEGFELDLQVQMLLWLMRVARHPQMFEGGVEVARSRLDRSGPVLDVKGVVDVDAHDRMVPCAVGPRRARVYTPAGIRGAAPALVFFHGGGFTLGSIDSHDGMCRALASRSRVVVVSVDYRLAPEHPFPAPTDDAVAATRWVLDNANALGVDAHAVAVGGDSAGGALAAVVSQTLRGATLRPAFQLLLYPATDATHGQPSHQHFKEGLLLTKQGIDWFLANYLPSPSLATDPRASPLLAADVSGLPPALVITAGFDPLRDEGHQYAERMRAAGVAVEYVCAESLVHGFMNMAGVLREPGRMLGLIAERLRRALSAGRAVASAA